MTPEEQIADLTRLMQEQAIAALQLRQSAEALSCHCQALAVENAKLRAKLGWRAYDA